MSRAVTSLGPRAAVGSDLGHVTSSTHLSLYWGSLAVQFVTIVMGFVPGGSRDTGIRNRCPFLVTSYGLLWFTAVRPV